MNTLQPLKSIAEEAADCRAAFKDSKIGDLVNFCHHEDPVEALIEPAETRIQYILDYKAESEQAIRLRLFRPIKDPLSFDWRLTRSLNSLARSIARIDKGPFAGNDDEYEVDDIVSGLHYSARFIREKIMEEYPFENLFGVKWEGDIFSTFHFEYMERER